MPRPFFFASTKTADFLAEYTCSAEFYKTLRDWIFALNETHENHDDGYDEEEVDESAERVRRNESNGPEQEKNNGDGEQHSEMMIG